MADVYRKTTTTEIVDDNRGKAVVEKNLTYRNTPRYKNWCYDILTYLIPLLSLLSLLTGLGLVIAGYVEGQDAFDDVSELTEEDESIEFKALWILSFIFIPLLILSAIATLVLSILAKRHEKRSTRKIYESGGKRHLLGRIIYPLLLLNEILLLSLLPFFLLAAYRAYEAESNWEDVYNCIFDGEPISEENCDDINTGYGLIFAGILCSLVPLIFLLMLNTAAMSLSCSSKYRKKEQARSLNERRTTTTVV